MDETNNGIKTVIEASGTTFEDVKVTSSRYSKNGDDMKSGENVEEKDETTSMKRMRHYTAEASDSSLEENDRDETNDGVPSTDTNGTNLAVQGGGSGGGISNQMRLEERRAYNRRNAARSRQRVKDQLRDLQQQVIAHTNTRSELERTNVRLLAENNVLRDEVQKLRTILSGAPLFGQQHQTMQPFLQQPYQVGLEPAAQFLSQGASQPSTGRTFPAVMSPTTQPASQMVTMQPQQGPFGYFQSSTQNQLQQVPNSSASFSMNQQQLVGQSGDSANHQNAVVQLLLQQIMNNNNSNNTAETQVPNTINGQEPTLQLHQQLQQQKSPQQQDSTFATLLALVGGSANDLSPTGEGTAATSQQASASLGPLSNDGQQSSASTTEQNTHPIPVDRPLQFDHLNVQEIQQNSLLSEQQQQQQQYEIQQENPLEE